MESRTAELAAPDPLAPARAAYLRLRLSALWSSPATRDALRIGAASFAVTALSGILAWLLLSTAVRHGALDPPGYVDHLGSIRDTLAAPFARWDSVWYVLVSRYGYAPGPSTAFFPLYPLLTHVVALSGSGQLVAGVIVSFCAYIAALRALWLLTELELGHSAARYTLLATAFFPMAFFFSAVYSESLYLAVSVWAFLLARRGQWAWAGLFGALAAATRSAGVIVIVGLGLLYLVEHRGRLRRDLLWLAVVPLGLAGYMLWLVIIGLDPFSPFAAQQTWFRHFAGPFGGIWDGAVAAFEGTRQLIAGNAHHVYFTQAGGDPLNNADHNVMLFVFLLAAVPALIGAWRRLPRAYAVYALTALALPLSYPVTPQPLMSLPRFLLVLFPLHMWSGDWLARHPRARRPLLGASALLMVFFTAEFATWRWVA